MDIVIQSKDNPLLLHPNCTDELLENIEGDVLAEDWVCCSARYARTYSIQCSCDDSVVQEATLSEAEEV